MSARNAAAAKGYFPSTNDQPTWPLMQSEAELRRLRWRATHRGTREADIMIGGFFEAHHRSWGQAEREWFARLLEEQDVDILAWALGTAEPPKRFGGPMMEAMQRRDYVRVAR